MERYYRIGGEHFAIRTTAPAFGDWLDATLGQYAVDDDTDNHFYSVVVAEGGTDAGPRGFHVLYGDRSIMAKTMDLATLGRTLLFDLDSILFRERDDAVFLDCALVFLDGRTALVPALLIPYLAQLGGRTTKAGLQLPEETAVAMNLDSGQVVPIEPRLDVPPGAVEALAALAPARPSRLGRRRVLGTVAVDVVCTAGLEEPSVRPISRASALYELGTSVINMARVGTAALDALIELVGRADRCEIQTATARQTLDAVVEVLSARPRV